MDQIEEIKSKTDIVALISEHVTLKKAGRNYKGLCPFHSEKTPSFMVSPQLQIFKCFGCGQGGDAIKFLQLHERMDFWEAVEVLAQQAGVKLKRQRMGPDEQLRRRLYELNRQAAEFYHFLLMKHSQGGKPRAYVRERGLKPKTLTAFKVGFSPLDPVAVARLLKKKGFDSQEMLQSGLVISSRYHRGELIDRFRGRLIFPLHDHRGNIVGFSGRLIPSLLANENQMAKYINSPETPVYHKGRSLFGFWLTKEEIKKSNQAFVVEGELDMISPWQAGIKNIVALKGTAFTEDQVRLIKRFAETAILAFDEDAAGKTAALRGVQLAENEGLEVRALNLGGRFKDPDEAAQKDPRFLLKRAKKTIPVWDFVIKTVIKKYKEGKKELVINDKKKILAETLPFLIRIGNEVEKDHYLRKLARRLKVSSEAVAIEAEKVYQKTIVSPPVGSSLEEKQGRRDILEGYLLGLIFTAYKPKKYLKPKFGKLLKTFRWQRVFKLAGEFAKKKKFVVADFLGFLPEELRQPFEEIFLKSDDDQAGKEEIEQTIFQLEKLALREKMEQMAAEIALAEKSGSLRQAKKLEKKLSLLTVERVELEAKE